MATETTAVPTGISGVGGFGANLLVKFVREHPSSFAAGCILLLLTVICFTNGFGTAGNPLTINPGVKLRAPSLEFWLGTDTLGRDLYSRVISGGRISILIGMSVAFAAVTFGTVVGLVTGYVRVLDLILMRVMDGLMAIPALLLAIAFVSLLGGGIATVVTALTIPEIPRVVRLVRSIVLTVREEPYIEAAIIGATPLWLILWRHVLPNTVAPMVVLGTYIAAAAILIEASLSFLGVGIPPEIPSWGNVIASGRALFEIAPWIIFAPSAVLALGVLSINVLGDGLRETLDPRIAKKI